MEYKPLLLAKIINAQQNPFKGIQIKKSEVAAYFDCNDWPIFLAHVTWLMQKGLITARAHKHDVVIYGVSITADFLAATLEAETRVTLSESDLNELIGHLPGWSA